MPNFPEALLLMIVIIGILVSFNIFLGIASQISLFLCVILSVAFAMYLGYDWDATEGMIRDGLNIGLIAMLINVLIGMLIAGLCASGTMPYLIYLGLKVISPQFFLVTTFLTCCVLASCTGSSYTTAGTVGVAMLGIGTAMGVNPAIICGAILGGCYFGDKISPVSESTVFASASAEASLFEHVHAMTFVIFPTTLILVVVYLFMGFRTGATSVDTGATAAIESGLSELFHFNPLLLLPVIVVLILIVKKVPAVLTLTIGVLLCVACCMIFQKMSFVDVAKTLMNGFSAGSDNQTINDMLKKGGLNSMGNIIFVMLLGMPLGGILKGTKTLEVIVQHFSRFVNTVPKAIFISVVTAAVNAGITGNTYSSYILTTAAFGKVYDAFELDRKCLSRTCEMSVVCTVLMPWTGTGMFMSSLFNLPVSAYAPYYFFGFLVPTLTIICGITGFGMFYTNGRRGWGKNRYVPKKLDKLELN